MSQVGDDHYEFGTQLYRSRDTPVRFVFATLIGSHWFWAGLVIGLPLVTLVAAQSHRAFVPLAAGAPVVICLFLQWMSHEFVRPRLVTDTSRRTVTKSRPYGLGTYRSVDASELSQVTIVPREGVAVIRLHYYGTALFRPLSTAITTSDIDDLKSQLEQMKIDVFVHDPDASPLSINAARARIIATPIAICGSLVAVWHLFGFDAFLTNAVIVPLLTMGVFAAVSYWWRRRLRRSSQQNAGSDSPL